MLTNKNGSEVKVGLTCLLLQCPQTRAECVQNSNTPMLLLLRDNSKLVHPNKKAAGVQARAGRRPPRNEAGIASTRADSPHQPRESSLGTLIASGDPK